ncbi:MAG: hypothetical protein A7315_06170 [Candidatus Altiarchaeales archaeon WOR_SM1_79]|nr:MAG: hypothetical protein A7315_06170 [Candidatus Altiarchaeales archaeon WOR_SM1_79]
MNKFPKISVIVPAYNAEKTIIQCIESLIIQDYPVYEIIFVDNNSTDKTPEIIKRYGKIKYIQEKKKGSYAARNTGVKFSNGEIIVFTDSDCILKKNWLEKLTAPIRSGKCIAAMGGTLSAGSERLDRIEQDAYDAHLNKIREGNNLKTIDTRNFAITRAVFKDGNFFNEKIMFSGDAEYGMMLNKKGYEIYLAEGAELKHFHKSSFKKVFKTKFLQSYYGTISYKKGLYLEGFRFRYYFSILFLLSVCMDLLVLIISKKMIHPILLMLPVFFLTSSPYILKSILKLDFYEVFYYLVSVVAIRLGVVKYLIDKYVRIKKNL